MDAMHAVVMRIGEEGRVHINWMMMAVHNRIPLKRAPSRRREVNHEPRRLNRSVIRFTDWKDTAC